MKRQHAATVVDWSPARVCVVEHSPTAGLPKHSSVLLQCSRYVRRGLEYLYSSGL